MKISYFLAFVVALIATIGSLYFSEVRAFIPCKLCWFQRILMYPLVLILFFQVVRRDYFLQPAILFSIAGFFLAFYHYLLQNQWIGTTEQACSTISCGIKYVEYFGFITIPFLSLTAFALISMLLISQKRNNFYNRF